MILIENSSNTVIISASNIILHPTYAEVERTKYYGGISDTTHTLITDKSITYGQASWWFYSNNQFTLTEIGLVERKLEKKAEISASLESHENEPVESLTFTWNGGYESAMKLDAAKRMSELSGLTEVTFFDVDNQPHVLSLADATTVILTIGAKYQSDFQKKQALYQQIEDATTIEELDAIAW